MSHAHRRARWTHYAGTAMMPPMRKLRIALIVAVILAIPASAYAYYEMTSGCPVTENCACD
jgi:hypothetical protein